MSFHHLALFLHLTGVTLWVGGMVFIRVCLAPMPPAQWAEALGNFFSLSWVSIALIVISGGFMLIVTGVARAPTAWLLMTFLGVVAIAVYALIWLAPWAALRVTLSRGDEPIGAAIQRINRLMDITLVLVALTATSATLGLVV